ncbi:CopD family protein [Ktedonospora formicarum]|uniref:Copper resistance protein CopC n=1 Tax=Ktedonospora formicarum TaxID=2778364 RepID=A0A8J3HYT8_9CHLR|nr:CopD family protein [Ktedonospora formicarum]GHO43508.1 hypothetical protein KSX_16710 [Ktedonospora formicarum]
MQAQRALHGSRSIYLFLALAFFLALTLTLLIPLKSRAYTIPQRSEPTANALLLTAPTAVHLWFSEDLNPALSVGTVLTGGGKRVDLESSVASSNTRELLITLQSPLSPGVYTTYWRAVGQHDGQTLTGSSTFRITSPDGTTPQTNGSGAIHNPYGTSPIAAGQLDLASVLYFLTQTLIGIGATFWVGGLLWHAFVAYQRGANEKVSEMAQQRFEQKLTTPLLTALFLANIGLLISHSLALSTENFAQLLPNAVALLTTGGFGTYWIIQQLVLIVALFLPWSATSRSGFTIWGKLAAGGILLLLFALSGHAFSSADETQWLALGAEWLHWLGTAMWVGGMLYVAWVYLPTLHMLTSGERGEALLKTLGRFSPLALTGLLLLAITGPFSASIHLNTWEQLLSAAYGRALLVKCAVLGLLLLVGAFQDLRLRPALQKDYKQKIRLSDGTSLDEEQRTNFEARNAGAYAMLETLLRWEAVLGIALLLCSALMSVYAATALPVQETTTTHTIVTGPFTGTARTSDARFNVQLNVSPARLGPNDFVVKVLDEQGKVPGEIQVSLVADMLDMQMGVTRLTLVPDGQGNYRTTGNLTMNGTWQIDILIRTADGKQHTASFRIKAS